MLKLFKGLKPYWLMVVGVLILVFISTMTDLALPDLMSDIVDTGIVQGCFVHFRTRRSNACCCSFRNSLYYL